MSVELLNIDCMEYMKGLEDNAFDLAIVDPPYGIGETWKKNNAKKSNKATRIYKERSYKNEATHGKEYFLELERVSKNRIIWGANYYTDFLPQRNSWIIWDKKINYPTQHMSEGEMAWTNFKIPLRIVNIMWCGCAGNNKIRSGIHPHEKPIKLYEWILSNYSEPGQKILDTHMGSGSSAIAAHYFGCDFVGTEIDKDYYDAACKRFDMETRQVALI